MRFGALTVMMAAGCGGPAVEIDAPFEADDPSFELVVEPREGNAPLVVTARSRLGRFLADQCELRVLGVPTGADLAAGEAVLDVERTSSVMLTCAQDQFAQAAEQLVKVSSIDGFTAQPNVLVPSEVVSLSWDGAYLANCDVRARPARSDGVEVSVDQTSERATHAPTESTIYTLICDGLGGPLVRQLRVPVVDVRVDTPAVVTFGGTVVLTIGVDRDATCAATAEPAIEPIVSGPQDEDLRRIFIDDVRALRTYTVTCAIGAVRDAATTALVDVAPVIERFDVVDADRSSISLAWRAQGAAACALDNGGGRVPVETEGSVVDPFGVEDGAVRYALSCTSATHIPTQAQRVVVWGDVDDHQQLEGVRAVLGDVVLQGDVYGDVRFDELERVTGGLRISDDTVDGEQISLAFLSLRSVGGAFVLRDLAKARSLLFPSLTRVGFLEIGGWLPHLSCTDIEPVVCGLDPDPAAQDVAVDMHCNIAECTDD